MTSRIAVQRDVASLPAGKQYPATRGTVVAIRALLSASVRTIADVDQRAAAAERQAADDKTLIHPIMVAGASLHSGRPPVGAITTWAEVDAALFAFCTEVSARATGLGREAIRAGDAPAASVFLRTADRAHDLAASHRQAAPAQPPALTRAAPTHGKSTLATATTVLDAGNNALALPVTSTGLALAPPLALAPTGAVAVGATVAGTGGGGLGILFGLIGVGMGAKATYRGRTSWKELRDLSARLGGLDDDVRSHLMAGIADHGAAQKRRKMWGGLGAMSLGSVAMIAGALSIAAALTAGITAGTLGIGAAVIGIAAAIFGLGLLIGRWVHKRNKRKKWQDTADAGAAKLVSSAGQTKDAVLRTEARATIAALGLDPTADAGQLTADIARVLHTEVTSGRKLIAFQVLHYLTSGVPSESVQAGLVLEALHVDPAKVLTLSRDAAVGEIARKLTHG
ncbi:hypothetical protein [Cellulosimicrobium arenosum]|uniref:Uncharacterized protein n=1 Tax=Cellulosimicrobium arenosum TaxID=2708133 RepID=A0A927J2M2_9MICO|nr:hypothetical protein [Cellulosimicrobium arenosum]MBD8080737.1 hypothetical protein [Cellulosimicrobium arenosum]